MKKIIVISLCLFCIVSCCEESHLVPSLVNPENLAGEWVYDNPREGVWETIKFTESGVFYFSNDVATWSIENDRNDGRYSINEEKVTGNYTLNGQAMVLNMTLSELNKYSFTAKFEDTGFIFTYQRRLGLQMLTKPGDTATPNYQNWVEDEILGFSTHDASIATVDPKTGLITAVASSGRTYIDVRMAKGTAAVEVNIFNPDDLFGDYTWAFGKTIDEVEDVLGNQYLVKLENDAISYKSKNLAVSKETYYTNTVDINHVAAVTLELNGKATDSQIKVMLNKKYRNFNEGAESYYYYDEATESFILYTPKEKTVTFMITVEWPDLNVFFGQDAETVKERMVRNGHQYLGSYDIYSLDGSEGYQFTSCNEKCWGAEFVLNSDKVVSQYLLYVTSETTDLDVLNRIRDWGFTATQEDGKTVYYNKKKTLKVIYDLRLGAIVVTDMTKKAFRRAILGNYWRGLGMSKAELNKLFGEPYAEDKNGTLAYISTSEYLNYIYFSRDVQADKVNNINVFHKETVTSNTITNYLNQLYKPFDSGSNSNGPYQRWISGTTRELSDMIITYYPNYCVIVYQHPSTASSRIVDIIGTMNKHEH